jgi:hypothetical protein
MACGGGNESAKVENVDVDEVHSNSMTKKDLDNFMHILPSHLRVALMFKNAGVNYNATVVADVSKHTTYEKPFEQAYMLGVYSVDLAYAAINNQTQQSVNFMKAGKYLAQQLGIEQIYEANNTLSRFEANMENIDSVKTLINDLFTETDVFLKDNDKLDVLLISMSAGWLEAVYISSNLAAETGKKEIISLIGDQRLSLTHLIAMMKSHATHADFGTMVADLETVQKELEKGQKTPDTETEAGVYDLSKDELKSIVKLVEGIRSKVVASKS